MPTDPLIDLIARILDVPPEQIGEDSGVNDTDNWDSIRNMFIMMELEKLYNLSLPFNAYTEIASVRAIRACIAQAQA